MLVRIWGICLILFALDFCLKSYTVSYIPALGGGILSYPYGGIPVFQNVIGIDFSLNYAKNTGAAWGLLANFQTALVCVRICITVSLLLYAWIKKISFLKRWVLSLIAIGAIGNIVDYFLYGHVVDMLYFVFWGYSFPVFNIADSCIFCGMVLFFLQKPLQARYHFLAKSS